MSTLRGTRGWDRSGSRCFQTHRASGFSHLGGELPHDWVTVIRPAEDCVFIGTYDAGDALMR